MSASESIEDAPLNQIVSRYFELLNDNDLIGADLVDALRDLFDAGKLGSFGDISKVLGPEEGESDEDPEA